MWHRLLNYRQVETMRTECHYEAPPGSQKQKLARREPVSFSQSKQLAKENIKELMEMFNGWKKEYLEVTAATATQKSAEEVVSKVQKSLSGEMAEIRMDLDKKKSERKEKTKKMKLSKTKLKAE